MNNNQSGNQLPGYVSRLLDILLLSTPFNFTVKLPPEDCAERLRHFEQPKMGFFSPFIQPVKITQEGSAYEFGILARRRGGSSFYNSAKASGIIAPLNANTDATVITGNIRLGITYLVFPALFLGLAIINLGDYSRAFGLVVLAIAIFFLNIPFGRRDSGELATIIREAFSEAGEITNGWP